MTGHKEELSKEYNLDGEVYSFIFRSTLSAATTVKKKQKRVIYELIYCFFVVLNYSSHTVPLECRL